MNFSVQHATRKLFFVATCCLYGILFPGISFSQSGDFTISTLVGDDTNAPSVPTLLVATPIATSQIDLSWSSSTDDYQLSGYHIWRDDVRIATTSDVFYSDTGLTQVTTYTYYITAYDASFNESASSSPVNATTLDVATIFVTDASTYGTRILPIEEQILNIEILPQKDSVLIRYVTDTYIHSIVHWGRTTSYELGSLSEQAFTKHHEIKIVGLTPGTAYTFRIDGERNNGTTGRMRYGTFTTLQEEDVFPPGNTMNLSGIFDGDSVILSWKNPDDPDLAKIRVVSNGTFYPSDIADGWVVYEGLGMGTHDDEIEPGTWRYYTVFAYDTSGNISSGAVVSVYMGEMDTHTPQQTVSDPTKNEIALTFDDLEFIQEGEVLPKNGTSVSIDGAKQLSISLQYDRVPEHLKTILVSIDDGTNSGKTFTFLLRVTRDRSAYTSLLAPFGTSGTFPLYLSVFDYKTAQIGYTKGVIVSEINQYIQKAEGQVSGFLQYLIQSTRTQTILLFLVLVALLFLGVRLLRTTW